MTQKTYVILSDRAVITVAGPDRVAFLQGLVSNDVRRLGAERALWAAFLTPQGKYLHDFFMTERDDVIHLDCEAARLMDLGRSLARYKLRSEVALGIAEGWTVAAVLGDDAAAALGLDDRPGAAGRFGEGTAFMDPRLAAMGARVAAPVEGLAGRLQAAGFAAGTSADYDARRFALGLADGSRDMTVEKSILLENGFDELGGVDWEKGCFLGQELTARTKYRGLIKKRLLPVDFDGPAPAPGTPITLDGKDAGQMCSGGDGQGLALLRLEQVDRAATSGTALMAGETAVRPRKPDWADF